MTAPTASRFEGARPDVIELLDEKADRARLRGLAGLRLSGMRTGHPFVMEASTVWSGGEAPFRKFRTDLADDRWRFALSVLLAVLAVCMICAQGLSVLFLPFRFAGTGGLPVVWTAVLSLTALGGVAVTWFLAFLAVTDTIDRLDHLLDDSRRGYPSGFDHSIKCSVRSIGFTETEVHIVEEDANYSNEKLKTSVFPIADITHVSLQNVWLGAGYECLTVETRNARHEIATPRREDGRPMHEFEAELKRRWDALKPKRGGIETVF